LKKKKRIDNKENAPIAGAFLYLNTSYHLMSQKYLVVDAHEDLAWNMLTFGRDYSRSVAETRHLEQDSEAPLRNGDTLLGWEDYQAGRVAVVFSTLFAAPQRSKPGSWDSQVYRDTDQAHTLYWDQVEQYHRFVDHNPDKFRLIEKREDLRSVISCWSEPLPREESSSERQTDCAVGLLILMEGAEGVRTPAELEDWWNAGVRIIGPAWIGTRFCGGTHEPGPMTSEGWALLDSMQDIGFGLDISHMDEKAALQALDSYEGHIIASHANAKALLKGVDSNRHLSTSVIEKLIDRSGVIGVVPHNPFLQAGWKSSDGKKAVSLEAVVAQIDFMCQVAGNANHVGLGSDFDGGFGYPATPAEINTIADLQKLVPLLQQKGYTDIDIEAIFSRNWLTLLERCLP
jgi:membrane dipeptidase